MPPGGEQLKKRKSQTSKKNYHKVQLLASISYFQNNQFNPSNYLKAGWTKMLQVPLS